MDYLIVYSFTTMDEWPNRFFPASGIVGAANGVLIKFEKNALPEIIESYGLHFTGTSHEKLFEIIKELSGGELIKKYNGPGISRKTISELYSDRAIRHVIEQKMDRLMDRFLLYIIKENLPLLSGFPRQTLLDPLRLHYISEEVQPELFFKKNENGMTYQIKLHFQNSTFYPVEKKIKMLSNQPGWVIMDNKLLKLSSINGKKLLPFIKKKSVDIQEHMLKEYFRSFILDMLAKVDVEIEGFEVETKTPHPIPSIRFIEDVMQDRYLVEIFSNYSNARFIYGEKAQRRVKLEFDDKIQVKQILRNPEEEKKYAEKLLQMGLELTPTYRFYLPDGIKKYDIIQWVITKKDQLEREGFTIVDPEILHHTALMDTPDVTLEYKEEKDWFDLKMWIIIGEKRFPFSNIISHIRNEIREFQLDDQHVFIIPEVWFSKYKMLSTFTTSRDNQLRIKKSNYPILKELEIELANQKSYEIGLEEIESFQLSNYLKADLRPYQLEGVQWMVKHFSKKLGVCLADDMGLGKTLQTIACILYLKEKKSPLMSKEKPKTVQLSLFNTNISNHEFINHFTALIVVPASLMYNWVTEIDTFSPHLKTGCMTISVNEKPNTWMQDYDVVLVTYQKLLRNIHYFQQYEFDLIVLDESQTIKNRQSATFKAIKSLKTVHKLSLSGTPVENSLSDLWSQMEFINPGMLGSYPFFKEKYQSPIERDKNEDALESLNKLVAPFILRRTREEVLPDLPDASEQIILCDMPEDQYNYYEKEKSAARNYLLGLDEQDQTFSFHVFSTLTRLRQIANHPHLIHPDFKGSTGKIPMVMDYLSTLVKAGKKVLIFSSFTQLLDLLKSQIEEEKWGYLTLTGKDSKLTRKRSIDTFQKDPTYSLFLISLKAGGTGLNLTAASYVIILDPWWNPFAEKQAIARAHRIGQSEKVFVQRFISAKSIEEKIQKLQQTKNMLAEQILNREEKLKVSHEDIKTLLA
ncbi:MAG TPA: DEAD/DEAH box helicase [Saprospiraceae bacterium]|nr:DEAD/DEAH box helicase [Saprospiraceae bacterium]